MTTTPQKRYHKKDITIEIPFKMERLKMAMRLKWVTASELWEALHPWVTYSVKLVYDWIEWKNKPPRSEKSMERIIKISKYLNIPIGFFFYEKVDITMENWLVTIRIIETSEIVKFMFS